MVATLTPIHSDPEILGGALVFSGTRVPVQAMFDYLVGGQPLEEFLIDFPTVSREHASAVLRLAVETLTAHAHTS